MLHHNPPVISIPSGGLADRIKNLIASIELSEIFGANVVCYWEPDIHCNGYFLDHFAPIPQIEFRTGPMISRLRSTYRGRSIVEVINQDHIYLNIVVGYGAETRIKHEMPWRGGVTKYHRLIKPSAETDEIISSFAAKHNIESIPGLHVRRTDKLPQDEAEKDDKKLVSTIRKIDGKFFLATDNRNTQDILLKEFGDAVVLFEMIEENEEYRQTSLRHAVVDLFLLSRCLEIIQGQYAYSGFTHLARNLKGKTRRFS